MKTTSKLNQETKKKKRSSIAKVKYNNIIMFGVYKLKRKLLPFLLLFALIVAIVPTSAVLASESGSAQIGDISYASLQEAFNAVPEDGVQTTVTLTNSIEISEMSDIVTLAAGKNIILNMNGQSITFKEDSSASPSLAGRAIINHGTLTVTGNGTMVVMVQLTTMVL